MGFTVALAGNPNCGKTTLFNKLTGSSQRVGNWPGVTVDKKVGRIRKTDCEVVDLPGIYSLSPYSPEEIVSRDFIVEERPDAVLNIVDATNLERNLYLTMQIVDCNVPTVIALNMMDEIEKNGDRIDVGLLSKLLGCPIVPISAVRDEGTAELVDVLMRTLESGTKPEPVLMDGKIESVIAQVEDQIRGRVPDESIRWHAIKLLEKDHVVEGEHEDAIEHVSAIIRDFEKKYDEDSDETIADARYNRIEKIVAEAVVRAPEKGPSFSEKADNILTNKYLALPIFIAVIAGIYFVAVATIGAWGTEWLNDLFYQFGEGVRAWCIESGVNEILTGLLVNGIIGGVGAVLGFLPQMIVLFFLMCIIEDIGYMSRIAFVMDRVFMHFGLSGKSLIPVLVGTGCGVPGVMSARTIESERERRITAMTVTFMPCGAKLPVIALIASALFGGSWAVGLFSYFLGIACVLLSGIILKKWKSLSGKPAPFIMELPPYHKPAWGNILKTTFDRSWSFVKRAGTLILLACVAVWFLSSFDLSLNYLGEDATKGSILQAIGEVICVIFAPLGWGDWQLAVSTITGLLSKESIIGTISILLPSGIASVVTAAGGLSFMVFNLVCAPCFAAVGAMHRELGTWKATAVAVGYQCLLAYAMSLFAYVIMGLCTGIEISVVTWVLFAIAIIVLGYALVAKDPFRQESKEVAAW